MHYPRSVHTCSWHRLENSGTSLVREILLDLTYRGREEQSPKSTPTHTMASMRVLDQFEVTPPPGSAEAQPPLPLTFFDAFWLFQSPVERFFLYDHPYPTTHFIESQLPKLKSSLSQTLAHFYPLAGKVRRCPDSENRFELRYELGDSVQLTVVGCDADFQDLKGSHARDFSQLRALIPKIGKSDIGSPLLAIQVTVFPDRGISIGFAVHHVACDGVSSINFIKSWAAACRSSAAAATVERPPSYDRAAITDPLGLYDGYVKTLLRFKDETVPNAWKLQTAGADSELVSATFTLSPEEIQELKRLARANNAQLGNKPSFNLSSFVVSCAYVWVCTVRARGESGDRTTHFGFVVDWRERMQPPVPASYFGNCIGPCLAEKKAGDLVGSGGVAVAAEAIGVAIQEVLRGGAFASMDGIFERFGPLMGQRPLRVAGSPRFRVYDVDFGWGRPQLVDVPSIVDNGAISLSESRDKDGGVQIGWVLPKHEMEEFKANFDSSLHDLHSR